MPLLGMIEAVGFHFLAYKADWDSPGRNLHIAFSFQIFGATLIEIKERLNPLMLQKIIDSPCIVSSIKEHFFYRVQGKTLRELNWLNHLVIMFCGSLYIGLIVRLSLKNGLTMF
ncbi:hypothetical protein ACFTRD_01180 [Paenibacillus sp. NPDC056933]|uniref:hypothetical protein n=1 Tax=Paenibacillus sp. NPDC056933 TaxID=3345968 RepID=UPI0036355D80